ncbi:trafficking kinesin-binding protein 1 [Galendromus occidentalis]|uniref:Trafficking kinesin-binding protein 1 n=1 Tax=Galendromus occidentalis TaxID=34638 RepID=A0AAJ7SG76_9ACAR|nr:trafficking kinesin-binding protein 1 [Galendromus occidentalis]
MTRTYDDTDALTRLLEEKERDLELAAHIGKSLLEEKRALQERIEALEQDFQASQETVTQLRHDLTKKNSLLSIYMEGEEEGLLGEEAPASLDLLHKKINELENENERLKIESQSWTEDLAVEEERETELINECVRELNEKNRTAAKLQEELAKKTESLLKHQDEITQLLSQQVDLQKKLREYSIENETLRVNLDVMGETQQELTIEISEARDKYNTLLCAFQGAYGAYTKYINPDSLAAELSMSLRTDNSEGYHSDDRAQTASASNPSPRPPSRRPLGSSGANGRRPASGEFDGTSDEGESSFPESYHTDDDSQYSSLSSIGLNPVCGKHPLGLDLNSPMRGTMSHSRSFYELDEDSTSRCRTPDSILSGFNGFSSGSTTSSMRRYRMPDKLDLIKRLEGSRTLHRWRRLATPTPLGLIGLAEETEGIKTRAVPKSLPSLPKDNSPKPPSSLDITSFLEEIDRAEESPQNFPGKSFVDSSCIYTYSNSNVLHPDSTHTTPSLGLTKMAISAGRNRSPVQTTPSVINRSSLLATTTCSVNRGLARILNERGIHAMLPSVLRERSEDDEEKTATSTPAPSPDQTPPGTPPEEDVPDNDELDALMPNLVRENRAKGVVLRAYRVDGKSSPLESAAVRRESLRRSKRGSQELDAQGLVSKLSRLVQWPFQGFVSDGNGNSDRTTDSGVRLTTTVTTTSTLTGEQHHHFGHSDRRQQFYVRYYDKHACHKFVFVVAVVTVGNRDLLDDSDRLRGWSAHHVVTVTNAWFRDRQRSYVNAGDANAPCSNSEPSTADKRRKTTPDRHRKLDA